IFTTPVMSGYAYSGLSSTEYKYSLCRAITTGLMPYSEFLKVLREFMLELRSTFDEIRGLDSAFEANVHRIEILQRDINAEIATGAEPTGRVLHGMMHKLYDVLYDCVTAPCNKDVARFIDPRFIRHGAHLQIAKACGVLVNSIIIVNCCAKTFAGESYTVGNEEDKNNAFKTGIALSAYVHTEFSAARRCLNPSASPEETKRRKAILRVLRHNTELCLKVSELISHNILSGFRYRTKRCLNGILNVVESTSAECEAMVHHNDESAYRRLAIAKKARFGFECYCKVHKGLGVAHDLRQWERGRYTRALVHVTGSLFSMYRGYASTGNTDHVIAGIIGHCLKILLSLPGTRRGIGAYGARKVYVDMCSVYEDIEQRARPELLLNPGAEVKLRDAALRYLSEMMSIWKELHERHLDVVEQPDGSPDQPSTSGLGSAGAGIGGSQASSVSLQDHSYAQPSTSGLGSTSTGLGRQQASYIPPQDPGDMPDLDVQPSTSAEASSALQEAQVASHRSQTPSDDELEPPSKRARSA
ncbi:HGE-14 family type IV secretion system effector, partial [Anaplasma phagocytophilum]